MIKSLVVVDVCVFVTFLTKQSILRVNNVMFVTVFGDMFHALL